MTLATFTPPRNPDPGLRDKPEIKVLSAGFGDGYTQDSLDGINAERSVVTLTWSYLSASEYQGLVAFHQAQGKGTIPFLYTLPGEASPVKWTWRDISKGFTFTDSSGAILYTITATFRQSFNIIP